MIMTQVLPLVTSDPENNNLHSNNIWGYSFTAVTRNSTSSCGYKMSSGERLPFAKNASQKRTEEKEEKKQSSEMQ